MVDLLRQILTESWHVLTLSAPLMLFGFLVAGLLKALVPDDFIARHLGKDSATNLFKAALFGVPIPLCSCGVLPAAAGIRKQGASKGATTAFLISTPETGVDSIAVSWALLDPLMALLRPFSAFITAIITGQLVRVFDPDPSSDDVKVATQPQVSEQSSCCGGSCAASVAQHEPLAVRLKGGIRFAFGDLFADIASWFFVGTLLAGLIGTFVTADLMEAWLGNPLVAMVAMLAVATPLYVCATASTPIAAALVLKGLNPGAALVFLLVGPATNAAALAVISKILGKRSMLIYLAGILICSFALGLGVDALYSLTDMTMEWKIGSAEEHSSIIGTLSALALLVLYVVTRFGGSKSSCCQD